MSDDAYIEVRTRMPRTRIKKVAYNKSPLDGTLSPAIRFSGTWLQDLGFDVGGKYKLIINQDKSITVQAVPSDGE